MLRCLLLAVGLTAVASLGHADEPDPTRLTLSPAAAPVPALKYELRYRQKDRSPGNAATRYNRTFTLHGQHRGKGIEQETEDRWLTTPRGKFPIQEVKDYLDPHKNCLQELESATPLSHCDWELIDRLKTQGLAYSCPEAWAAREMSILLRLRIRVELAEGRFEDAVRSLRTGFTLAQHVGEAPSLLYSLTCISIANKMADRLEEFVQTPGTPNLYWALGGLPRPVVDLQPGLDGEEIVLRSTFPMIEELENGVLSEDQAFAAVKRFFRTSEAISDGKPDKQDPEETRNAITALVAIKLPSAKESLKARGRSVAELERMPPAQVVFLDAWSRYRELYDDLLKLTRLPAPVAMAKLANREKQTPKLKKKITAEGDVFFMPFQLLTPSIQKVFYAHVRLERRLAALRVIEALRMHVAANGGKFPAKLEEVKAVAVPDDPATGKPFAYEVKGDTAVLSGPPPVGQAPTRINALRYELTVHPASGEERSPGK